MHAQLRDPADFRRWITGPYPTSHHHPAIAGAQTGSFLKRIAPALPRPSSRPVNRRSSAGAQRQCSNMTTSGSRSQRGSRGEGGSPAPRCPPEEPREPLRRASEGAPNAGTPAPVTAPCPNASTWHNSSELTMSPPPGQKAPRAHRRPSGCPPRRGVLVHVMAWRAAVVGHKRLERGSTLHAPRSKNGYMRV